MPSNPHQSVQVAVVQPHPSVLPDAGKRQHLPIILINPDGSSAGTVVKAAAQANSTAATVGDLVTDFNALLAKLRSAGVIASS